MEVLTSSGLLGICTAEMDSQNYPYLVGLK